MSTPLPTSAIANSDEWEAGAIIVLAFIVLIAVAFIGASIGLAHRHPTYIQKKLNPRRDPDGPNNIEKLQQPVGDQAA